MGGHVAVGIIDEDGKLETIVGWTNSLPKTFQNASFIRGDYSALRAYAEHYRKNQEDLDYGVSGHVPSEYGYILFDLKEKAILSAQGYTTISDVHRMEVRSDDVAQAISGRFAFDEDLVVPVGPYASVEEFANDPSNDPRGGVPTMAAFWELLKEKSTYQIDATTTKDNVLENLFEGLPDDETKVEFLDLYKRVANTDSSFTPIFNFQLDFRDWTIAEGGRNADDLARIRDYIAERVALPDEDAATWTVEIAELRREEAADAEPDTANAAP